VATARRSASFWASVIESTVPASFTVMNADADGEKGNADGKVVTGTPLAPHDRQPLQKPPRAQHV
jgi:hypothetical protein